MSGTKFGDLTHCVHYFHRDCTRIAHEIGKATQINEIITAILDRAVPYYRELEIAKKWFN